MGKRISFKTWLKIFNELKGRGYRVIPTCTLKEITGLDANALKVALWRLEKDGLVCRVGKRWICIDRCTENDIVRVAFQPGYISMEWALYIHNILEQTPYTITIVWLKPRKKIIYCGYEFEAHKISKKLFFGFDPIRFIAEPEKALLDLIYIRKGEINALEIDIYNLDKRKLSEYSFKFPKWVQNKLKKLFGIRIAR